MESYIVENGKMRHDWRMNGDFIIWKVKIRHSLGFNLFKMWTEAMAKIQLVLYIVENAKIS